MVKVVLTGLLLMGLLIAPAFADCTLSEIIRTNVEGKIETIKDIQKSVVPASVSE